MSITRVQASPKTVGNNIPFTLALTAFGTLPTVGNAIVIPVITNVNGSTTLSCADNRGNTYTLVKRQQSSGGGDATVHIFLCEAVVTNTSPFTITLTRTAGGNFYAVALAIEVNPGVGKTLVVDQSVSQAIATTALTTGPTAAVAADELFLAAACSTDSSQGSITVESVSPTWIQEYEDLSFSTAVGEANSRVKTGTVGTTQSCSWTGTSSSPSAVALVAFRADPLDVVAGGERVNSSVILAL